MKTQYQQIFKGSPLWPDGWYQLFPVIVVEIWYCPGNATSANMSLLMQICTYDPVHTSLRIQICTYEPVRASLYIQVCTCEPVNTSVYIQTCTYDPVHTSLYIQSCTYGREHICASLGVGLADRNT